MQKNISIFEKRSKSQIGFLIIAALVFILQSNNSIAMKNAFYIEGKQKEEEKSKEAYKIENPFLKKLLIPCLENEEDETKSILIQIPELANQKDSNNNTGLIIACINNNTELAIFIAFRCKKEILNHPCVKNGPTPLIFACRRENLELMNALLKLGADPDKPMLENEEPITPLNLCCKRRFYAGVKLLLEYKAKIDELSLKTVEKLNDPELQDIIAKKCHNAKSDGLSPMNTQRLDAP